MSIQLFKLVTGEEVIGTRVMGEQVYVVEINKPFTVIEMFTQQGATLMLRPYFRGAQCEALMLRQKDVLAVAKPQKHLEDAYLQQTSGIQLVTR